MTARKYMLKHTTCFWVIIVHDSGLYTVLDK